jgi:hypothetical protein
MPRSQRHRGIAFGLSPSHHLFFELRRGRVLLFALTGMSYAIAALCRPTFLLSLFFTAVALAWTRPLWRQRTQVVAAMSFGALLILFPWAARNEAVLGKPVVTTTHGGYTLLLGNNADYYRFLSTSPRRSVWRADRLDDSLRAARSADEVANDRREYALAWQTIREQPGMFFYASLRRLGALWGLLPHRLDINESRWVRASRYATAVWYLVVFGLALTALGSGAVRATAPPWLWATMLVASFTATHVVYWTDMRMRAPLVPAIALLAAAGAKRLFSSRGKVFNLVR